MFFHPKFAMSLLVVVLSFISSRPALSMGDGSNRKLQIHRTLYTIYKKQQRNDLAIGELRLLVGLNPNDQTVHGTLGSDLFEEKKWAAALDEFNVAVKVAPNDSGYWGMIGRCDMQLHRYSAASDAYQKAVRNFHPGGTDYRQELQQTKQYVEHERLQTEYKEQQKQRAKDDDGE